MPKAPEPGDAEPRYINGILAYMGDEILRSAFDGEKSVRPVISKSELDETFDRDMGNEVLYLRDREVLEVAATANEIYMSLEERNRNSAIDSMKTLKKEYDNDYTEFVENEDSLKFLDYRGKFEVPSTEELGVNITYDEFVEIMNEFIDPDFRRVQ